MFYEHIFLFSVLHYLSEVVHVALTLFADIRKPRPSHKWYIHTDFAYLLNDREVFETEPSTENQGGVCKKVTKGEKSKEIPTCI